MKRSLHILGLVVVAAGCAAHSTQPNEQPAERELVTVGSQDGRTFVLPLVRDDYVTTATLAASREKIWELLPAVYAGVGLPEPGADASIWTVAVQNHAVMRTVGDARMSQLLDCGMGVTGQHADNHRIRLSVRTWLEPAGTGTDVRTRVEATASSVEGRAGSFACSSRGALEMLIANALHDAVSGS